jgi:hypothetical protein
MKIVRPNLKRPDVYRIEGLEESLLLFIEDGVELEIQKLEADVEKVQHFKRRGLTYKQVSIVMGGTGELAKDVPFDPSEDLEFLYTSLADLNRLLWRSRYMREHPNEREG